MSLNKRGKMIIQDSNFDPNEDLLDRETMISF